MSEQAHPSGHWNASTTQVTPVVNPTSGSIVTEPGAQARVDAHARRA